jgi:endo-1,4-beta-xylanase
MAVTRPPAPHRRRAATRTVAVALAATIAVGAAAVAIPAAQAATTLKDLATAAGKDIGFALDPNRLSESAYKSIADTEFNLVVAENAMKWDATEPSQNSFSYGSGDQVASYAASTGKELYGHTLVWHSQMPGWTNNLSGTALESAMKNHVTNVATHFKGKVSSWDVVNEAFGENGERRSDSPLQQKIGDGYIETAFRTARAADPNAKLCINDYNTDAINSKSTAIYNLVKDFKSRGVPIDCVGFQSHLIIGQVPSPSAAARA